MEPRPPGLRDRTDPPILHSTGGEMCGGTPNCELVARVSKNFTKVDKVKDVMEWRKKRDQFWTELTSNLPDQTLYSMVSVFQQKWPCLRTTIKPMLRKEKYFTSMEHFLREVEHTKFPNPGHQLQMMYNNRRQEAGESIRDYWIEFADLAESCDQDPLKSVVRFVEGVQDPVVKSLLRIRLTEVGGETMKAVENLLVLADGYERDRQMDAAAKKQEKGVARVAAASTSSASATVASTSASTRPKKPRSPPPRPPKQQPQLQQDALPQSQQQEHQRASPARRGRGGTRRGGRGRNQALRQENERLQAQVAALTGSPSASVNSEETSPKRRVEDEAQRRLRELAER